MNMYYTQLFGRSYTSDDTVIGNEIIRPTNYFTLSDFGTRKPIFEIVSKFENITQASYALEQWKREGEDEDSN